jgi:hypothetical protein
MIKGRMLGAWGGAGAPQGSRLPTWLENLMLQMKEVSRRRRACTGGTRQALLLWEAGSRCAAAVANPRQQGVAQGLRGGGGSWGLGIAQGGVGGASAAASHPPSAAHPER